MESQSCPQTKILQAERRLENEEIEVDLWRAGREAVARVIGRSNLRSGGRLGGSGRFGRLGDLGGRDVGRWSAFNNLVELRVGHFNVGE